MIEFVGSDGSLMELLWIFRFFRRDIEGCSGLVISTAG